MKLFLNVEKARIPIKQFMTRGIMGIDKNETIKNACKKMIEFGISSLAVLENEKIVGFLTKKDIIEGIAKGFSVDEKIKKIMSKNLVFCDSSVPIEEVLDIMANFQVRHILIKEKGEFIGIFSLKDIIDLQKFNLETQISSD
ncbi:CBS domain-containing protein [bacterium]|nr:CBS domain-containing protein [bacterium]HDM22325.1 CBS domain-containing protein [Methanomicrobia archaeon]